MPTTTTNVPLVPAVALAARLQNYISGLSNPAKLDPTRELQQIAEDQSLDIGRVLGTFTKQFLDGESSQPATVTEFFEQLSRFITQGIADYEQRVIDFERRFIDAFSRHPITELTPQSFHFRARTSTDGVFDSTIELTKKLNKERAALEKETTELQQAFKDPDGRIILAFDRIHTVGNQLTVIMGCAHELKTGNLKDASQLKFLRAIQTTIRRFAEKDIPTLAENPIELFGEKNPHVAISMHGSTPVFHDERHSELIKTALDHLVGNALEAGAKNVRIKAECQPSDPILAIGIEDDGPGIPETTLRQLVNGQGGSGWRILREVTFPRLGAHFKITSPFQNSESGPYGTLVMLFIPVVAQAGYESSTGRARRADSGPIPAAREAPPPALPAPLAGGFNMVGEQQACVVINFPLNPATKCR